MTQFTQLIHLADGKADLLQRVPMTSGENAGDYSESWLQDLMFNNPGALPVMEIDPAYGPLIPLCREFNTPAGPIDIIYISPNGSLTVVECKLWRNPEARRKVVGQIIDYAKELASMDYTDLEREWRIRTKANGGKIYQHVMASAKGTELDEATFIDTVQRNLKTGNFLLMVLGDGIRSDVEAISDFMNRHSGLNFIFSLVEAAIYRLGDGLLVQPRVIAKTMIMQRHVVTLVGGQMRLDEAPADERDSTIAPDPSDDARLNFWDVFLKQLKLDDEVQPLPKPVRINNIRFSIPDTHGEIWFTVYRSFSSNPNKIGVFYTCSKGSQLGRAVYDKLLSEKLEIEREISERLDLSDDDLCEWNSDDSGCIIAMARFFPGTDLNTVPVAEQIAWLSDRLNRFVNALRHRVERHIRDIETVA